jgi:hypothetical protein
LVNEKLSVLAQKKWSEIGKEAVTAALKQGAGHVPFAGGAIKWGLDQVLTDRPPGQPITDALIQLAVVREFHAKVWDATRDGVGTPAGWTGALGDLGVLALAVEEAKKQVAEARQAVERIETILSANYNEAAIEALLERVADKATPAVEMTTLRPRVAPFKPLATGS